MPKFMGIASSVTASLLAGWILTTYKSGSCSDNVAALKELYLSDQGNVGYGRMMGGLKHAEAYCKAGELDQAEQMLGVWAANCRRSGGCGA